MLDTGSPVLLRMFLTSIFIASDITTKEKQLYCDKLCDQGSLYQGQVGYLERFGFNQKSGFICHIWFSLYVTYVCILMTINIYDVCILMTICIWCVYTYDYIYIWCVYTYDHIYIYDVCILMTIYIWCVYTYDDIYILCVYLWLYI